MQRRARGAVHTHVHDHRQAEALCSGEAGVEGSEGQRDNRRWRELGHRVTLVSVSLEFDSPRGGGYTHGLPPRSFYEPLNSRITFQLSAAMRERR
jgi:hypothetical protein